MALIDGLLNEDQGFTAEEDEALTLTNTFVNQLFANKQIHRTPNIYRWKKHFEHLIQDYGPVTVRRVLGLFEGQPCPVKTAEAFKKAFKGFLDRASTTGPVDLRQDAMIAIDKLDYLSWPCSIGELKQVINESCEKYDDFYKKFTAWDGDCDDRVILRFCNWLDEGKFFPPTHIFMQHYWFTVNQLIQAWPGWSGSIRSFAFGPRCKHFRRLGYERAFAFCCRTEVWDKLIEEILK